MSGFTPESGHELSAPRCPLCAKSRHSALRQLFDHLVGAVEQRQRESDAERLGRLELVIRLSLPAEQACQQVCTFKSLEFRNWTVTLTLS